MTSTPSSRTTRSSRTWTCSPTWSTGCGSRRSPRGERRERAMAALDTVRLTGYGDRRPTQLSGGQRQRVALARALVNRPKVLLLDEPLGALDLKLRREMQIELKQIQREVGITFCFVTHDQEEALTMSDRIAVFNDGRVEQVADSDRPLRVAVVLVRRRLRRHLQPAHRRRRQGGHRPRRHLQHPAREDPLRDEVTVPTAPAKASGVVQTDRLPRLGQPLPRRARRGQHPHGAAPEPPRHRRPGTRPPW